MPTRPTTIDASKYREMKFIGGRILQPRELQLMEDLNGDVPSKGKFEFGGLFEPGTTLNATISVAGGVVTLSRTDGTQPMLVFLNNAFEAFTAGPVTFPVSPSGTQVQVFVNYVLWRVTSDGEDATLTDPTLVDSVTQEPTAEMGQLQVYVGADDSGAVDALTMFDRNLVPIPMVTLTWQADGTLKLTDMSGLRDQLQASPVRAGVVKVTGSPVVVSADDSRLSDTRVPTDASVSTDKLLAMTPATPPFSVPFVSETGVSAPLTVDKSTGGIDASRVLYSTWSATLSASLGLIWSTIVRAFAVLKSFGDRIQALETATPVDLSTHIGKNLGLPATHPAVSDSGFTANDSAVQVYSNSKHANVGLIGADGNYNFPNSDYQPAVTTHAGTPLNNFLALAQAVVALVDNSTAGVPSTLAGDVAGGAVSTLISHIKGKSVAGLPDSGATVGSVEMVVFNPSANQYELAAIPTGGPGGTLAGDVTGSSSACTVARLQSRPVNSAAPAVGQTLIWDGASWSPGSGGGAPVISSMISGSGNNNMAWLVLRFGKLRVAWGTGQMHGGVRIVPPTSDWNSSVMPGSFGYGTILNASFAVINTFNVNFLHCLAGGDGSVIVDASGPDSAAAIAGAYVSVSCFTTGVDA